MSKEHLNINEFLDKDEKKDLLRLLTAGSVDDGKSTLIGRLLYDSKKLYEDQLDALERDSKRSGNAGEGEIDYSLLLDGLKAEREQGITIDVAYRYFSTNKRKFIIADTPGHEQYTRNMITGGSTANLAIILVDARTGVITQTKRHTYLVSLLGIKHVVLAVNKMDLVHYDQKVFDQIVSDYKAFIKTLDIPDVVPIPISALKGDNVVERSDEMPWYKGKSLLDFLETVPLDSDRNFDDFRYPVQYVLRPNLDFRGFSAKVASGVVRKGDRIMALPSGKTSKVKGIHVYEGEIDLAFTPQSVTITLDDEIDISRGEMIVHPDNLPIVSRHIDAMLVWMDENAMAPNKQYEIKHTTNSTKVRIDKIHYKIDVNTLEHSQIEAFSLNEIGKVSLTTIKPLIFDSYKKNKSTGAFILIDPITNNTCAVGMIIGKAEYDEEALTIDDVVREQIRKGHSLITPEERAARYGQKGQTIWITGLHGSGKRELAYILERRLFDAGKTVVVLDGATVHLGVSHELEYSATERKKNLLRIANLCSGLNNQGFITICAYITAEEETREQIKKIIGEDRFTLVYMDETVESCRKRQPDMWLKAETDEIIDMPGLTSEYAIPLDADYKIKVDDLQNIEDLISKV